MKKMYALVLLSALLITASGCSLFEINTVKESNEEESNIEEAVVEEENAEEETEVSYKKVNILSHSFDPAAPGFTTLYVEKQELKNGDYFVSVCAPAGVGLGREAYSASKMEYIEMPNFGDTWALTTKLPANLYNVVCNVGISHSNGEMEFQGDMYDVEVKNLE